jgi:hypothetical protein
MHSVRIESGLTLEFHAICKSLNFIQFVGAVLGPRSGSIAPREALQQVLVCFIPIYAAADIHFQGH